MSPDQLWETTLNPETRVLKQIKIKDNELTKDRISDLMGKDVKPRKEFISKYGSEVELYI